MASTFARRAGMFDSVRTPAWLIVITVACATPRAPARAPSTPRFAPSGVTVRFVERAAKDQPWKPITDAARLAKLRGWLDIEPVQFALGLYAEAWAVAPPPELAAPTLFIGLEEGGNHAEVGLDVDDGTRHHWPELPYLRLDEDPQVFRDTLLHESGHAMHALLARGALSLADDSTIASIPHSTAAVTDRRTAFNEGFAEHLEAVNAHCGRDPVTRAYYDHAALHPGPTGDKQSEYFFAVKDVMTYAQQFARYQAVRDGAYGFETAAHGDYLRVQLDPARDLRTLRDAGSLVANEGFVAGVLFHTVIGTAGCGDGLPSLLPRYREVFRALHQAETTRGPLDAAPLVDVVAALGAPAITVFLDLSHGATVDPDAAERWAQLYDAAITVDVDTRNRLVDELEARRKRWLADAIRDPATLLRLIGPVVAVAVPSEHVKLVAFGSDVPMMFDVNAAGAPMLGLVPGWGPAEVGAILSERRRAPFANLADFVARLKARTIPVDAIVDPATLGP